MLQLLSIEWLKIRKYRTFWILAAMFTILLFTWNWFASSGVMKLGGGGMNMLSMDYTFPNVWDNVGHWTKLFSGLLAIVIVILTTNEYQYRTHRQNVIDGWHRSQFFHAKWMLVITLSVIVTLYTFLQGVFFAGVAKADFRDFTMHIEKMYYVFVMTLNYFGFALTLSLLIRRSGMSIILFLLYGYVIELMAWQFLNWKFSMHPGDLLPMQCSAELLNFPMIDNLNKLTSTSGPSKSTLVYVSLFWTGVYYVIGRLRLLKSDW